MLTYNDDFQNINKISRIPERRINVGQTQGLQQGNYNPNLGDKKPLQMPSSFGNKDQSQNNDLQIGRNRGFGTQSKEEPQSLIETKYSNYDQSRNNNFGQNLIAGMSNTYTENNDYGFIPRESPQKLQILPPRVRNGAQTQDKCNDFQPGTKNSLFSEKPLLVVRDQFEIREEQLREQLKKKEKEILNKDQKEKDEQMASKENQKRQNLIKYQQDQKLRLVENQALKGENEKTRDNSKEKQSPVHYNAVTQNNNLRKTQTKGFTGTYQPNALNQDKSASKLRKGYTIEEYKPIIINNEEKLAVATGIEENPIDDSTQIDEELFPCTEGCGRQFAQRALEKHVPICKKVFLQKRNEFNTQQKRIVDADQAKLIRQAKMKEKIESTKVNKTDKNNKQKDMIGTKSNWKEESEKLRQQIKLKKQPKQN